MEHKLSKNELTSALGEHVTQICSKTKKFDCIADFVDDVLLIFHGFPNLETLEFPQDVDESTFRYWDQVHRMPPGFQQLILYLRANPIPKLNHLRNLSFGNFPSEVLKEIIKTHADQLLSLECIAKITNDKKDYILPKMPKLKELTFRSMKLHDAGNFVDFIPSPLEKLALIGTKGSNGIQCGTEMTTLLMEIGHHKMFKNTLKILELEFSGNVMWTTDEFPKLDLPHLKIFKFKHCSNVEFELYSNLLFSLIFIRELSIDKAHCGHPEQGRCHLYQDFPSNCAEIDCNFRAELRDSDLWTKLPQLSLFSFRGCGMKYLEDCVRENYNKLGADFMNFFTDPSETNETANETLENQ